jgi:uncharacterized protein
VAWTLLLLAGKLLAGKLLFLQSDDQQLTRCDVRLTVGGLHFHPAAPLRQGEPMGFDQYHEPPEELPPATRTFARLCASLTEEAEAIGWYEQRIAVETDSQALAVMRDAQGEEFKHFSMDLEFLLRRSPAWREIAQGVLFQPGDIVEHGEEAEAETFEGEGVEGEGVEGEGVEVEGEGGYPAGSLGIGGLKGAQR